MINLQNVTLRLGQKTIFHHASMTCFAQERIGLVGANGSGKSTLFNLLLGHLAPDMGDMRIQPQLEIAHVKQEMPLTEDSALDYVLTGDRQLVEIEQAIAQAEADSAYDALANLHARLADIDGYTAKARASRLLVGLGFSQDELAQPVSTFSGGWRIRLNLAQALMCRSDLLLLDEPTNHLDLDAIMWLEKWLQQYTGTLILISHDREFLDAIVSRIIQVEQQQLHSYTGDYTQFEKASALKITQQQAAYEKQQKKIAHVMSFVDRFRYKATKARQAQSRLKSLEKMQVLSAVSVTSPFEFQFGDIANCPSPLVTLDDVAAGYGDNTVLQPFRWGLVPKERIGLLGPNGAGKSTFIKLLAGHIKPQSGIYQLAKGVSVGYYAQHQLEYLNVDQSPMAHIQAVSPKTPPQQIRNFLGGFGFSGEMAMSKIAAFSGGEKARVALALLVWSKPQILLLDEPTNHLDMAMRNALSLALQDFDGAMILCSHDRYLLSSSVDSFLVIYHGRVVRFDGDINLYYQWIAKQKGKQGSSEDLSMLLEPAQAKAVSAQTDSAQLKKKTDKIAKKIKSTQAKLASLRKKSQKDTDEYKRLAQSLSDLEKLQSGYKKSKK